MAKFIITSFLVVVAVASVHGFAGDLRSITQRNDISITSQEARLLEIPSFSAIVYKTLGTVWFLLSSAWSLVSYKWAAVALAVNAGLYALSFVKFPVIIGAVLMLGLCKLTGLCGFGHVLGKTSEEDHLAYSADYLELGAMKYGKRS